MPERKTLRTCANIVLAISLVMIGFGFLGIKINQTKAPVPSSFLIDLCKKVGTPITIIGAVLLVAAIIAEETDLPLTQITKNGGGSYLLAGTLESFFTEGPDHE